MVHFERSQPAPECLAVEKAKASGSYRCDGVATQLMIDFKNKCYLCEAAAPIAINIEHFRAHGGDRDLMFAWENLFYCCAHCNNVKQMMHFIQDLLDCTNRDHSIDQVIRFSLLPFPGEHVALEAMQKNALVENTIQLLLAIYNNGQTEQKEIQSANLREALLDEVKKFQRMLEKYLRPNLEEGKRNQLQQRIIDELQNSSAFTAFKRWIIRDSPILIAEFGESFS